MKEFKDKVAVITGAASGIGLGIAKRCVQEGMKVVLADIEQPALIQAEEELTAMGGTVLSIMTDVSKLDQVEELAKKTLETFGTVDLLCNNAGVAAGRSIWESSISDWEWVIAVNLWGVIYSIRTFIPIMLSQDTECYIVNTASMTSFLQNHLSACYQVTKHALLGLSEHLYESLALQGAKIKTSVLCPGFVKTGILRSTRNRQEEFEGSFSVKLMSPEVEEAAWKKLESDFTLYTPEQIADILFNAIEEEKFYILTNPELDEMVRRRMDDILQGQNPVVFRPEAFGKA